MSYPGKGAVVIFRFIKLEHTQHKTSGSWINNVVGYSQLLPVK